MADEITIKPQAETTPSTTPSGQTNPSVNIGLSQLVTACAAGLGVCFFLPWARFFGGDISGFDLQKLGGEQRLHWAIPIFSAITIVAGITKSAQRHVAQITGALPFFAAIYWYNKLGSDLTKILNFGAYLSLICGAALYFLSRRLK